LKLTPVSQIAAMVGAPSGVTLKACRPSGTNSTTLLGRVASAPKAAWAATAANANATRILNLSDVDDFPLPATRQDPGAAGAAERSHNPRRPD
jgi:hypothetical protein